MDSLEFIDLCIFPKSLYLKVKQEDEIATIEKIQDLKSTNSGVFFPVAH